MAQAQDERVKQVMTAAVLLAALAAVVVCMLLFWRLVPGVAGEWLGMVVGIMSSPFFMEATFVALGVLIVMVVNAVRRHREGDDFVTVEELAARQAANPTGKDAAKPATGRKSI